MKILNIGLIVTNKKFMPKYRKLDLRWPTASLILQDRFQMIQTSKLFRIHENMLEATFYSFC